MKLNNVRTDNILRAAAEVAKAQEVVANRETWYQKARAEYVAKETALEEAKERLSYSLKKLEVATE